MKTDNGARRGLRLRMGGWLYRVIRRKGWPRRLLLAAALLLALLCGWILHRAFSYRHEPAALVPRPVSVFVETRQLGSALRDFGGWSLWSRERREDSSDGWNSLQGEVMAFLNGQVAGLSTRPRKWFSSAIRGAFASGLREGEARESWAVYLYLGNPEEVVADIGKEPGVSVETLKTQRNNAIHRMRDEKGGSLVLGVVGPWLILSSDDWLPGYALEVASKPSLSLAGSGMLPAWGKATVRGLYDPGRKAVRIDMDGLSGFSAWIAPDARVGFTSRVHRDNRVETNFHTVAYTAAKGTSRLWPLLALVLWVVVAFCVAVVLAIVLTMIGLGGWIKFLAVRAGVHPAPHPITASPSPAFMEDAGILPQSETPDTIAQVDRETADGMETGTVENEVIGTEATVEDNPETKRDE